MKTQVDLVLLDSEPGEFTFYTWQNFTFCCWEKQATGNALQRLNKVAEKKAVENAKGSAVLLVAEGAGMPTAAARAGFIDLMNHYADQLKCVAIVVRGGGFWASSLQGVITGIRVFSPRKIRFHINNSIDEVIKWLPEAHARSTGVSVNRYQLLSALQQAEAVFDPVSIPAVARK